MSIPIRRSGTAIGRCTGRDGGRPRLRLEGAEWTAGTVTGGHQEGDLLFVGFTKPQERRGAIVLGPVDPYLSTKEFASLGAEAEWGSWGCTPAFGHDPGGPNGNLSFGSEGWPKPLVPYGAELRVTKAGAIILGLLQTYDTEGNPEPLTVPCHWALTNEGGQVLADLGEDLAFAPDFEPGAPTDPTFSHVPYCFDVIDSSVYIGWAGVEVASGYTPVDTYPPEPVAASGPVADTSNAEHVWWV